ncbi:hypothetical protein RRG08_037435 [Elysia crispata]|uniref:Uncharacterized protein n=1 Tax=Elysia crispata TaxID=231223 RepID=A0AAE0Y4F7_9GAST|nr:hypothetical protein RRG08_037435 [Elysia crispata]
MKSLPPSCFITKFDRSGESVPRFCLESCRPKVRSALDLGSIDQSGFEPLAPWLQDHLAIPRLSAGEKAGRETTSRCVYALATPFVNDLSVFGHNRKPSFPAALGVVFPWRGEDAPAKPSPFYFYLSRQASWRSLRQNREVFVQWWFPLDIQPVAVVRDQKRENWPDL